MIGLDTNILLRAAVRDDATQTPIAERIIAGLTEAIPGHVNLAVLSEFAWSLERRYDYERDEILAVIEQMLESKDFVVAQRDVVSRALTRASDEALDFPDALIGELNVEAGCTTTLTFDKKAARLAGFSPAKR